MATKCHANSVNHPDSLRRQIGHFYDVKKVRNTLTPQHSTNPARHSVTAPLRPEASPGQKNRTLGYLCGQRVRGTHFATPVWAQTGAQMPCLTMAKWKTDPSRRPYDVSTVTHAQRPKQKTKHHPSDRNVTMTAWLFGYKIRRQLGQQPRIPTTPVWGKVRSEKNPQQLGRRRRARAGSNHRQHWEPC